MAERTLSPRPEQNQDAFQRCQHCCVLLGGRKRRFCSAKCRNQFHHVQRMVPGDCPQCGKVFVSHNRQRCCSISCAQTHRARREGRGARTPRPCKQCGVVFVPKIGRNIGLFCSRECCFVWKGERKAALLEQHKAERLERANAKPLCDKFCPGCRRSFKAACRSVRYCGERCRNRVARRRAYKPKPKPKTAWQCIVCGDSFLAHTTRLRPMYCTNRCSKKAQKKKESCKERMRDYARRRCRSTKTDEAISPFEIFARDGWRCGICGKKVKRFAQVPDPLAPTIDHIVPVSKGGEHTKQNVQCAHFLCNARRGDRGSAQSRLFG